jgi:cold shock CspA family protein/ribosome-associated translation inhibitor RaiA
MQVPLQITFRHMDTSEALAARIRERVDELDGFFDGIISCRVAVEQQTARHHKGNLFRIRVDLNVPGREIVVGRDPIDHAHEDAYVATRNTFDAVRRQLEDYVRERRSEVKLHAVPDHGRVARLIAEQDYGFIATADGSEIYFHRNSVANGEFDKLAVGHAVRFVVDETESAKGPQASTVVPLGKHQLPPTAAVRS